MSKKEFSVLFDTPDYIQTSDETKRFLNCIELKMKDDFDKTHPNASEMEVSSLESYKENREMFELVTNWILKVNAQLDQISERQAEMFAMISSDKKDEE